MNATVKMAQYSAGNPEYLGFDENDPIASFHLTELKQGFLDSVHIADLVYQHLTHMTTPTANILVRYFNTGDLRLVSGMFRRLCQCIDDGTGPGN